MKLTLQLSPFTFEIETNIPAVVDNIKTIYPVDRLLPPSNTYDYPLKVLNSGLIRHIFRPQARFLCDQREPFKPLNYSQAYAILEWGMNWTVASHEMAHVMVHSAVLAKNGKAILFPAPPGSGKSTLTAHLAFNGWQLLSDEMALLRPGTRTCTPFVRPICLKNRSIELAKQWFPQGAFSTVARDTHKGDVIHLSPPSLSWQMATTTAEVVGVVFPQYDASCDLEITTLTQAQAYMQLVSNAFNYAVLGELGFKTLTGVVENAACYAVRHSDLALLTEFLEQEVLQC